MTRNLQHQLDDYTLPVLQRAVEAVKSPNGSLTLSPSVERSRLIADLAKATETIQSKDVTINRVREENARLQGELGGLSKKLDGLSKELAGVSKELEGSRACLKGVLGVVMTLPSPHTCEDEKLRAWDAIPPLAVRLDLALDSNEMSHPRDKQTHTAEAIAIRFRVCRMRVDSEPHTGRLLGLVSLPADSAVPADGPDKFDSGTLFRAWVSRHENLIGNDAYSTEYMQQLLDALVRAQCRHRERLARLGRGDAMGEEYPSFPVVISRIILPFPNSRRPRRLGHPRTRRPIVSKSGFSI